MTAPWPTGQDAWAAYAARCIAHYPQMATDWESHAKYMTARRNAAIDGAVSSGIPFDGDLPLSLEEEEELQKRTARPWPAESQVDKNAHSQMELF